MKHTDLKLVDMHCHILPKVDHGSQSLDTSINLILKAREIGIDTFVATSHFYYHECLLDDFLITRERSYRLLTEELQARGIKDVKIIKAAEVALERNLLNETNLEKFRNLCIDQTDFILLEMPLADTLWSPQMYDMISSVERKYGVRAIIAHIERYNPKKASRIIDELYPAQVNADLFSSFRGKRRFMSLLKSGSVQFLGSDCHDEKERNYDNFSKVVSRLSPRYLQYFSDNARAVLAGKFPDR
jgi:protein-tyrosine phosphatase